jgi:hypothetical protein
MQNPISFPEFREGTRGCGIIRCRKTGILAKIELCIPFQRPIRFLSETDYPRASRSFPRIAGSGNEIDEKSGGLDSTHSQALVEVRGKSLGMRLVEIQIERDIWKFGDSNWVLGHMVQCQ